MRPQLHRPDIKGPVDRNQELSTGPDLLCDGTDEQNPATLQGSIAVGDRGTDRVGVRDADTFDSLVSDSLPEDENPAPKKATKRKLPTQRSLELLRKQGYLVGVVERWNQHAGIRQDLFGFVDLVAVRERGETLAVQACSRSNVAARVHKIADHPNVAALRKAGWRIVVHGWAKLASGRWEVREVDCS